MSLLNERKPRKDAKTILVRIIQECNRRLLQTATESEVTEYIELDTIFVMACFPRYRSTPTPNPSKSTVFQLGSLKYNIFAIWYILWNSIYETAYDASASRVVKKCVVGGRDENKKRNT